MLIFISLLLLFFPVVYQYRMGNKSLNKAIETKYIFICIWSFMLELIFTFISFFIVIYDMGRRGYKCLTGAVGIFPISFIVLIVIILVIVLQLIYRNRYSDN